jgi:hypothetical protein
VIRSVPTGSTGPIALPSHISIRTGESIPASASTSGRTT